MGDPFLIDGPAIVNFSGGRTLDAHRGELPADVHVVFATECFRAGVVLTTIQAWMGHKDVETTKRYLGRYREDAAEGEEAGE